MLRNYLKKQTVLHTRPDFGGNFRVLLEMTPRPKIEIDDYRRTQPGPAHRQTPAWLALLALVLSGWLAHLGNSPPAPLPLSAAATEFSAERARDKLRVLLGSQQRPHPIGSSANTAVRDRLIAALAELGLSAQIQRTIGCAANSPVCGFVENVIAVIENNTGATDADVLLIMAHYDSVPPAPGAGDDGAGVAAILESVRAYQARGSTGSNAIALLFTDGEESGLLGAEAFFAEHPLRTRVHAVINLEGAGSGGGPVHLLRSANHPGHLLDAFRRAANYPAAMSVVQEVFNRMPNDTDFSVANRAGIPSLDFAFGSEFNHYHSRLDSIENLHMGTLQHHGENLLPLLDALHNADLRLRKPVYAYQTLGPIWIHWSESAGVPLAICALMLVGLAAWRAGVAAAALAAGTVRALVGVIASALVCAALMWLAELGLGSIASFPDTLWPWRLLMFSGVAGSLLVVALVPARNSQPPDFWPLYLGVCLLLSLFALALAWTAPLAANLFVIPTLMMGIAALLAAMLRPAPSRGIQSALVAGSCVALGALFLGLAPAMEASQGLALAPAVYLMIVFAMLPLIVTAPSKTSAMVAAGSATAGLIWAISTPMYSAEQPQFVSIHYQQNADTKEASWLAYAPNPLPQRLLDAVPYTRTPSLRFPWESAPSTAPRSKAPWIEISHGALQYRVTEQGLVLNYQGAPSVEHVIFVLPREQVEQLSVNGTPVTVRPDPTSDYLLFKFYAPGAADKLPANTSNGQDLEVVIKSRQQTPGAAPNTPQTALYLIEGRSGLPPAAANQLAARGATAMPHHQGDQWLTFRRIVMP